MGRQRPGKTWLPSLRLWVLPHPTGCRGRAVRAPDFQEVAPCKLGARGPQAPRVTVALARARAGCRGAMAPQLPGAAEASQDRGPLAPPRRKVPPGLRRGAAPVGWHPRQRAEASQGDACRERGRHPTAARKGVANPRRAAGATVVFSWLRFFRCTEDKKYADDLKNVVTNSCHWKS